MVHVVGEKLQDRERKPEGEMKGGLGENRERNGREEREVGEALEEVA